MLEEFASLDWRRNEALAEAGYKAAEAMKDKLLPLALDDDAWRVYQESASSAEEVGVGHAAVPVDRRRTSTPTSVASRKC